MNEKLQLFKLVLDTRTNRYRCELGGKISQFIDTMASIMAEEPALRRAMETAIEKAKKEK